MYLILRPWTPPFSFASSNAMRMAWLLLTPWIAVTPDRSVMVPMTPRTGSAARAPVTSAVPQIAASSRVLSADRRALGGWVGILGILPSPDVAGVFACTHGRRPRPLRLARPGANANPWRHAARME